MNKILNNNIYLDYNATTPLHKKVLETMLPFLKDKYENPSAMYSDANKINNNIDNSRKSISNILNIKQGKIIFTSSGTESDNLAIKGAAFANKAKGNHIITSQIEHHAVLNTFKYLEKSGFNVTYLPVSKSGIIEIDSLKKSINNNTILISTMLVNNETGVIQPVKKIAEVAKENNIIIHTDAVQAAGKIKIDVTDLNIDMLTLSAHKFYGPKGSGLLYLKDGVEIEPIIHGGNQENKLRAGTENTAGIIGLTKALELATENIDAVCKKEKYLRNKLENGIIKAIPDCIINGNNEKRICNTLNIIIKYIEGVSILTALDRYGIKASSISACKSKSIEPSHVLLAMGILKKYAVGVLRFSIGLYTTEEEIDTVLDLLPNIVKEARSISPF